MPATAALEPVSVDKPWGREIWYSGIESRGESGAILGGERLPLSRFLAEHGRTTPPVLLKALEPTRGDLYLELHERKHEVYIVDAPAGGSLLLGVDARRLRALGDSALRSRLLAAARQAERSGRIDAVAAYMNEVRVRFGDAVDIPPRVPHSLKRGARVIEFQTPVFERRILAASQPVASQRGWDSARATDVMDADTVPTVLPSTQAPAQRLADAAAFSVTRYRLRAGAELPLPAWAVGWVQAGTATDGEGAFAARTAFITSAPATLSAASAAELLVAEPTPAAP